MARPSVQALPSSLSWTCRQCRTTAPFHWQQPLLHRHRQRQRLSTATLPESTSHEAPIPVRAAPEIDLDNAPSYPARVIPASPSYFTGFPQFNDDLLYLQNLVQDNMRLPECLPEDVPRIGWFRLIEYRNITGENVASAKYAKLLLLLNRLKRIQPRFQTDEVRAVINKFMRASDAEGQKAKPGTVDHLGRTKGVGRRKESSAKVYLVEGTGEVLVNGRSLVQAFPRPHDRESALWALKITERMDKYNVFALVHGGGVTGQAEAVTLGLARALLVHEPALKPALRRAGCVTSDWRRVERKKPGRLKARKRPTWVKR